METRSTIHIKVDKDGTDCENCYWYENGLFNGWCDEREIYIAPDSYCAKWKERKDYEKNNN